MWLLPCVYHARDKMHIHQTYFHRVQAQTPTKFWINNVTREEAHLSIKHGAVGCTQNPACTWKLLQDQSTHAYVMPMLDKVLADEADDAMAMSKLQALIIQDVAKIFLPLYEESKGKYGYVSIQENPFNESVDFMVNQARVNRAGYPNIMIKIPVTVDGLKAIDILLREGVPINATEVMTLQQAIDVCRVYERATKDLEHPPVMVYSHIAGIYDQHLKSVVEKSTIDISPDALWQAGVAVSKKIHQITKAHWPQVGFVSGGARGLHHFTEMVGGDCIVTINWKGTAEDLIQQNPPIVQRFMQPTPHEVIDELCNKLEDFRKAYFLDAIGSEEYEDFGAVVLFRSMFEESWEKAQAYITARRNK